MIDEYIGMPWRDGAQGNGAWACYPLVRDIYKKQLGVELPSFEINYDNIKQINNVFSAESKKFKRVHNLRQFDIIAMGQSQRFIRHFGIFIDGAVLHSKNHFGVVHENIGLIKQQFKRVEFYRWQK